MKPGKLLFVAIAACTMMPAMADTASNYLCDHRQAGSDDTYGQQHYACDVAPFGDVEFVEQKLSELVFVDNLTDPAEYVNTLYPVLRDSAAEYYNQRTINPTPAELEAWQHAVLALAEQQSLWTHFRKGSDDRLKMARGNDGHGHGLMQLDDREHFADIVDGAGWNIFRNLNFAMDSLYAGWAEYPQSSCASDTQESDTAQAQYAFARYTGGPEQGCRFTSPDNPWAELDAAYLQKLEAKAWLEMVADAQAPAVVNAKCYLIGDEGCVPIGPLPAPKADIGSTGRIFGLSTDNTTDPGTIATCRTEPNLDTSTHVEWIRTTTNQFASYSELTLHARQGDWVQVSFAYSGLTNTCWTEEWRITWDGFEPPAPPNDTLFAYKQLQLSSGETCLHNNGEFHCVERASDALCLLEMFDTVTEPEALALTQAQTESQDKIVYDRHQCLGYVDTVAKVGDVVTLAKDVDVYDSVGGNKLGTATSGNRYQILDVKADTKYQHNRYYKIQLSPTTIEPAWTEGEGDDAIEHPETEIPAVYGYFFAGSIDDFMQYTAEASDADQTLVLRDGQNFKVNATEGVSMYESIGGDVTLTIPQNTIVEVMQTEIVGSQNSIYYHVYRKGLNGVVYGGQLTDEVRLNTDIELTSESATADSTPEVVSQDSPQSIASGGSLGWAWIALLSVLGLCRRTSLNNHASRTAR